LNLDQRADFYVTNFSGEYNTLYEQQSAGTWKDSTAKKGLIANVLPMVGFGTVAADYDNNGLPELFVSNGNVDTYVADETTNEPVLQTQPVQLFELNSALQYTSIQSQQTDDYMRQRHFGRGVWTWDVNRDGRVDTGVTHQTEAVAVLVNHSETTNHWIELQLVGVKSARDAIGSRVTLHDQGFDRVGWVTAGDGYLCSSERVVRFGIGKSSSPCRITISWPDGSTQALEELSLDARWQIVQGNAPHRLD
ncbi:ASPIC/UnbV domain-containing protein, partial [Novipirellula maiorica]|uniref:ASPIC/UnbV domain-containing protein n=1 Tax=Novipirellula maiorica TaxID=1265734 RepID=UPI000593C812